MDIRELASAGRKCLSSGNMKRRHDENWFIKIINAIDDYYVEDFKNHRVRQFKEIMGFWITGDIKQVNNKYTDFNDLYIDFLKGLPYGIYLKTKHWNDIRKYKLKSAKYTCQKCNGMNTKLHVHHKTYENRGHESIYDLIVLCEICHKKEHGHQSQTG